MPQQLKSPYMEDKEAQVEFRSLLVNETLIPNHCTVLKEINANQYWKNIELKDGGYSWMVLFALFVSNILTAGYIKSFGLIYNSIVVQYPDTSIVMSGVMLSLLAGFRSIFAPLIGAVIAKIGTRKTLAAGSIVCFFGLAISTFCTSVAQLSVTLGALMGIGMCIIETGQVVIIANYFETKLPFANGIRVSGNPLGGISFPILLLYLLQTFGARFSNLMLAAVFLNLLVCAALIRPLKIHKRIQVLQRLKVIEKNYVCSKSDSQNIYNQIMKALSDKSSTETEGLEIHFLKMGVYWIFILLAIAAALALPLVLFYLPIYGHKIGLTPTQNSFILSIQSFADILLRIGMGLVCNKKLCKLVHGFIFSLFIGGVGTISIPFCTEIWGLTVAAIFFSFGSAAYCFFTNIILTKQFGERSIASTCGFILMIQGIFGFVNPIFIGFIVDITGGFTAAFVVMGFGLILAAIVLGFEPLVIKFTKSDIVIS